MPTLYLPETAHEQLKWEQAGIRRPKDGGPDCEAAAALQARLQDHMGEEIAVGFAERGSNEGKWGIYHVGERGPVLAVSIATADGGYKYPSPEIASTVRDTQKDPAHYEKLMADEYARMEKNHHDTATEWGQRGREAANWVGKRFTEGENFAHRKGIKLHKDKP